MGRIDKDEVGYRQQMIMQCIWEAGGAATVPDIDIRLEKKCGTRLSRSALNTMIQTLIQKGLAEPDGKIHQSIVYRACISEEEFRTRELLRVKKLTFDNSTDIMAQTLINSLDDAEELDKIRDYLEKRKKKVK